MPALSTLLNPLVGKCRSIWLEEVAHSETKQETEDAGTKYMRLEVKKGRFEGTLKNHRKRPHFQVAKLNCQ